MLAALSTCLGYSTYLGFKTSKGYDNDRVYYINKPLYMSCAQRRLEFLNKPRGERTLVIFIFSSKKKAEIYLEPFFVDVSCFEQRST